MDKKIILALIVISLILLSGCLVRKRFSFAFGPCNESVNAYNESELGVRTLTYTKTDIEGYYAEEIHALVSINCADNFTRGGYRRIGNDRGIFEEIGSSIILLYDHTDCEVCATCICAHELVYNISHVPLGNYNITLERFK
jgi:hypothetical protein